MANPLLQPSSLPFQLPDYAGLTDADFREAIETGMAEQLAELDQVARDESPATVGNVIDAIECSGATLTRAMHAFWVAKAADTNDERDEIEADLAPRLAAHSDAILLDDRLYGRLRALAERRDRGEVELDAEAAYRLDRGLLDYERAGIALPEDEQARLRELNEELATLSARFDQLLVAGRNAAAVLVTDEAELDGLDEDARSAAREAAERDGRDGWLLELTNTTDQPVLGGLRNRALRERVFRASVQRGLSGEHDTREVLLRLVRLRAERASLLGYEHHAAYVAADSCAGSTTAVNEMLARLAPGVVANARHEAEELQSVLEEVEPGATLEPWDWRFCAERLRERALQLDEAALRPYLSFERVLHDGVFAAATALYGITFEEKPDLVGYAPGSRVFEVLEEDGPSLGAVVIDPFTRPTKQGGAWMTNIVDQSGLLADRPVVTNTCNFPPPGAGRPSLLSWDNVITLFHEFGHDLHGLFSDVRYPSRSGTAVPTDFVEFPSQVNEIWAWHPALIAQYARHHETGEPIPADLLDTLVASRHFGEGFGYTESVAAAALDQAWHQAPPSDIPDDVDGVEDFERRALAGAGIDLDLVPPRYRSSYFHHIFGGGYSAGYYSYLWSEIMDADTVAWFSEHGEDGGLDRAAGERFRRHLLAPGGSVEAMETYRDFRGSDPDFRHLLERIGVDAS